MALVLLSHVLARRLAALRGMMEARTPQPERRGRVDRKRQKPAHPRHLCNRNR